jgi:hypothetical protein
MKLRNTMIALGGLVLVFAVAGSVCATTLSYNVVDLGPLPNSHDSSGPRETVYGWTINNSGQVAGYGLQWSPGIGGPPQLGFVWSNGTWTTFNDPGNTEFGVSAYGLNNSGEVVGVVGTSYFVWSQGSGMTILPYTSTTGAHPAINDNGLVVGNTGNGSNFAYNTVSKTASTWTTTSGDGGWTFGVDDSGQVVGTDMSAGTGYLWTSAGGKTTLSGMSFANGISNNGTYVAGCDSTANENCAVYNTSTHGVTIVDNGAAPDGDQEAYAVNNSGVVVGENSDDEAFVYVPGVGEIHLANAIASGGTAGADYVQAVSINNAGQILVQGIVGTDTSDEHTWLFTPVATPEPSTLLLAATGLSGLLAYAWRKRK